MNLKDLRARYEALNPDTQKKMAQGGLIALLVLVTVIVASVGGHRKTAEKKAGKNQEQVEDLQPHLGYLEKSLYYETTTKVKALDDRLKTLSLELKDYNDKLNRANENKEKKRKQEIDALQREIERLKRQQEHISKSPQARSGWGVPPAPGGTRRSGGDKDKLPVRTIGGLGHAEQVSEASPGPSLPSPLNAVKQKQEEGRSVYLPPSLVSADLISGFAAPTMEAAKSEPVRVLLRIRDLAVLPNEVKSDLKGCFVIAEGYGNLADERGHLRLLRLSCVARDGTSVIDEKVKGFVVDEDGRIGLRGRVVTKMGSFLARSMVAGFLQGFGNAYSGSGLSLTTTAAGQVQTLDPKNAVRSGIGKGISKGAEDLSKFYLELARQTFPVIEVGAGKRVTMVIEEGVDLKIRERCLGGRDGCREKTSSVSALNNI